MPDYRIYGPDENGKLKEQPVEKLASFMGVSEFDANLLIKGMNITKAICVAVGLTEEPPLIWNQNMPASLVEFLTGHVADQLKNNPAWELTDFDWSLLYDGNTLKYR
jgi:hypothetical protein